MFLLYGYNSSPCRFVDGTTNALKCLDFFNLNWDVLIITIPTLCYSIVHYITVQTRVYPGTYCESLCRKCIYSVKEPLWLINFIWINFHDINALIFFSFSILFQKYFIFTTYSYLYSKPVKNYYWALIYKENTAKKMYSTEMFFFGTHSILHICCEKINMFWILLL